MAKWNHDKITFSGRGVCHLPLGGQEHTLRFRAHEIDLLETRMGYGVMEMLKPENMGIRLLKQILIVGVSHEYVSKKRGQKKKGLTEQEVARWIDGSMEKDGIEFEDLMEAAMRCVIGGLPNGQQMLDMMDEDDDGDDGEEEGVEDGPFEAQTSPKKPAKQEPQKGSTGAS
jgi:hypothetical protein